ncbi:hypothetical protein CJO91_03580 [Ralstonia solanacearum]|nr:hypothetical protein CJO91_03580 [Ralstonia solanacearum]
MRGRQTLYKHAQHATLQFVERQLHLLDRLNVLLKLSGSLFLQSDLRDVDLQRTHLRPRQQPLEVGMLEGKPAQHARVNNEVKDFHSRASAMSGGANHQAFRSSDDSGSIDQLDPGLKFVKEPASYRCIRK